MTPEKRKPPALDGEDLARVVAAEKRQRAETKKRGLPIEPVSVEALWLLQAGVCGCKARCAPLTPSARHGDPDAIVIGHQRPRSLQGGHTIANVRLQRADCNALVARQEKTDKARFDKFTVNKARPAKAKNPKQSIPKRKDAWNKEYRAKIKAEQAR